MTRYFRGLTVGLLFGLLFGFILHDHNAPSIAFAVPAFMLVLMAGIEFLRWLDSGDVDR